MVKAHIVQHTHWDREWYFTTEDAKVLSDQVFTEVLDELERNPDVNFCLDGQSSIVDEYLELNPDRLPSIQKLMKEKRLFIGPWFTQTDALLVDAESILRNLIIGINDTLQKYGEPMMVGYLPDTFGFSAQLPTLLNQVGIDSLLCWRGVNFKTLVDSPYFVWRGLGDKSVYAINFPFGYMTGLMTLEAQRDVERFVTKKLDPAITFLHTTGNNTDILIPSGIDQKNIVPDFDTIVKEINSFSKYESYISDYPTFVDSIKKKTNLPKYQGELREPMYSRLHRTISSVRSQMKVENFKLEQKILRRIEPLLVIARKNNIQISDGLLHRLWKKVLENQAHDSIGGCVSDNVAEDIFHRIKEANEISDGLENLIGKRIADDLDLKPNQVVIFNTDLTPFHGEKTVHIVSRTKNIQFENNSHGVIVKEKYYPERKNIMRLVATGYEFFNEPAYYELDVRVQVTLPPMGYKVISFNETNQPLEEIVENNNITNTEIKNDLYTISFTDGVVSLTTKDGKTISNFISLVDAANDGDTYDYSPLLNDLEITLDFQCAKVLKDSKKSYLRLYGESQLPYALEDRTTKTPKTDTFKYQIELQLDQDNPELIEGKIKIDNHVLSHRLRLQLSVGDYTEKSIAQIQNGFISNQPEIIPVDWKDNYVEKPVNLEVFDKSVSVENDSGYTTIFVDGIKEYERVKDTLLITLMATTGELGKPNLAWRPGRASGDTTNEGHIMMPTPLAQELGEYTFTFAIKVSTDCFNEMTIAKTAYERLTPSITYQKQTLNVFVNRLDNKIWPFKETIGIANEFSLKELPKELLVSAIYPSYTQKGTYIVRLANPTKEQIKVSDDIIKDATLVNAVEKPITKTSVIAPYDYLTLKFNL